MSIWYWIGGIGLAIGVYLFLGYRLGRRNCVKAFGQGYMDVTAPFTLAEIKERYKSYLYPSIRPMEATAYICGVESCLFSKEGEGWEAIRNGFDHVWSTGRISQEGTALRRIGAEVAEKAFSLRSLRIPEELEKHIADNPEVPPFITKVQLEMEAGT